MNTRKKKWTQTTNLMPVERQRNWNWAAGTWRTARTGSHKGYLPFFSTKLNFVEALILQEIFLKDSFLSAFSFVIWSSCLPNLVATHLCFTATSGTVTVRAPLSGMDIETVCCVAFKFYLMQRFADSGGAHKLYPQMCRNWTKLRRISIKPHHVAL